jgi:hypothetical protein
MEPWEWCAFWGALGFICGYLYRGLFRTPR